MQAELQKTVLVVDDQATARRVMRHMLGLAGYGVKEAASGEQALAMAGEDVDAVVMDLMMPGFGGIETCRRLRATARHRMTPILIVATPDSADSLAEAFEAGCDDFIPKPVQQSVLDARLTAHLERSALYRQLERMHRTLNRYVSPRTRQMAEQYACSGTLPPPHQVEVCVLFTDIRGFTQLSQDLDPERLFSLLSRQLALQVDLVYEHGGYVDKYAGDGIMAVFEGEERAEHACRCALDIIANARSADSASLGSVFAVGCGLHDGPAVIGNIGSRDHLDYSVIGGTVNLAARLCGFSDRLAVTVSQTVRNAVPAESRLNFSTARAVDVKGFRDPVVVYRLLPDA